MKVPPPLPRHEAPLPPPPGARAAALATGRPRRVPDLPLRVKLGALYALVIAAIGCGAYFLNSALVDRGFRSVERDAVRAQLARADAVLGLRLDALYHTAGDWATWDATYDYMLTRDPAFEQENLFQDSLATLGVTFMLFVDTQGSAVHYLGFDLDAGTQDDRWNDVASRLKGRPGEPPSGRGLVSLGDAAALVAFRPILRSDGSGPARGTLVIGRTVDATIADELSRALASHVELAAVPADALDPPSVRPTAADAITGTALLAGIDGGPALRATVHEARPVARQARLMHRGLLLALLGVATAGGLAVLILLEIEVAGPLTRLTRDVEALALSPGAAARVGRPRGLELGRLAVGVNELLHRLERRGAELSARERRFRQLFLNSPVGTAIVTERGRIVQCNPAFERIFGYSRTELAAEEPALSLGGDGDDLDQERDAMRSLRAGTVQRYQWERRFVRKDGTPVYALLQMSPLDHGPDEDDAFITQVLDFTARRAQEEEVLTLAFQDPLTGLPNRRVLQRHLSDLVGPGGRATDAAGALLYLDLDGFKVVNDTHGHDVGDRVLTEAAQRMSRQLREHDMLARLGGDEFAAYLPRADEHAAREVAARLANAVAAPLEIAGYAPAHLGVSVGIALGPAHEESLEAWLRRADEAMYDAKRGGGGRAVVAPHPAHNPTEA